MKYTLLIIGMVLSNYSIAQENIKSIMNIPQKTMNQNNQQLTIQNTTIQDIKMQHMQYKLLKYNILQCNILQYNKSK